MAKPVKLSQDGLPLPLPVRPLFKPLALVLGGLIGLAVVVLLQQAGRVVASTTLLVVGVILGILLGIALPSVPYVFAARNANEKLAKERSRRASLNAAGTESTTSKTVLP